MMIKIEIVKYLLAEIEEEQKLIDDCRKAWEKAEEQSAVCTNGYSKYHYFRYSGRNPSKSRIKANVKKIRQLMLDVGKEL